MIKRVKGIDCDYDYYYDRCNSIYSVERINENEFVLLNRYYLPIGCTKPGLPFVFDQSKTNHDRKVHAFQFTSDPSSVLQFMVSSDKDVLLDAKLKIEDIQQLWLYSDNSKPYKNCKAKCYTKIPKEILAINVKKYNERINLLQNYVPFEISMYKKCIC